MARPRAYIMVGIDFGTTYSGVAWAFSDRPDQKYVVMNWEGIEGQTTSAKVPSQILYRGDRKDWGFNISLEEKPLRWFKLLLLQDKDMGPLRNSAYIREARDMVQKLNKSAEDVVADYLGLLWKHALKDMKVILGEEAVDGQPFRVVITFPAIWPLYAQTRLRQAAYTAGISDRRHAGETILDLCPEPEAATLAVMDDFDGHLVESGDIFVICDAGGGTVDLITYRLEDTEMYKVSECVAGAGDLCGAIFVDEAFDSHISEWLGDKKWKKLADSKKREWKDRYWEHGLKRTFNGQDRDLSLILPLPYVVKRSFEFNLFSKSGRTPRPQIVNDRFQLQRNDMASIFDPSIDRAVTLVLDQIEKAKQRVGSLPKAVLLVGGLGQSPYLYARLQKAVSSQGIQVRKPPEDRAWTAIFRGALIRAYIKNAHDDNYIMQTTITSRVVRTSYGIAMIEPFDPAIHNLEDKQYIAALGQDCAVNQMHWYIQRDEDITDQRVIKLDWSRKIRSQLHRNRFTVTLLKCDRQNAPRRKEVDVRPEGEIVCVVDTPFDQLPDYTNLAGEVWKSLDFQVEMKPRGTMLEFAVHFKGQRQKPLQVIPPFAPEGSDEPPLPPQVRPQGRLPLLLN